jgi:isopentenyldiphosphate isomerase
MKEKIIIVDKNDNIIWSKYRNEVTKQDIYRVSALWITNSKWDILLAQRAFTKKHHPGCYGPAVAGTIEIWETYYENIIKETEEEIWVTNINIVEHNKVLTNKEHTHFTQRYTAILDKNIEDFIIQEEEVAWLKWITKHELLNDINNFPEKYIDSIKENLEMF